MGQLVDKHTFLGLVRIDYKSVQTEDQGYYEQIPEEMTFAAGNPVFSYIRRIPRETVHELEIPGVFHRAER